MAGIKGDYIGFTYNGTHSSELGITRVSDGSRYNENLLPSMQDKTAQVPGADGTYYFGSYYTQKQFNVNFAFDDLTEHQLKTLKAHFGDKGVHDLIFDEIPYKIYSAKVTGSATIKYIPFAEGADSRLYKGEGTIQFTCYNPFARSNLKWLSEYKNENKEEWAEASRMKDFKGDYDVVVKGEGSSTIKTFNPGVKESDFIFTFHPIEENFSIGIQEGIDTNTSSFVGELNFEGFSLETGDKYVVLNSKTNLIEGYSAENKKTGTVYNQHIVSGDFFKIVKGEGTMVITGLELDDRDAPLKYDYYYF